MLLAQFIHIRMIQRSLGAILCTLLSVHAFAASLESPPTELIKIPEPKEWISLARLVGAGESSRVRLTAIKKLEKIKHLNPALVAALDHPLHKPMALDVISNLYLRVLVPDLLERVSADEDGFLILTLNSMMNDENKTSILTSYVEVIGSGARPSATPAGVVAMLEPLGRLGVVLRKSIVSNLLEHEYPEVRSAALYYVRMMVLKHGQTKFASFVPKAYKLTPFQLRLQALFIADEIASKADTKDLIDIPKMTGSCEEERAPAVKTRCLDLASGRRLLK